MNPPEFYAALAEQCVAASSHAVSDESCRILLQEAQVWATLSLASANTRAVGS